MTTNTANTSHGRIGRWKPLLGDCTIAIMTA
jgi:hypothetical protein